MRFFTFHSLPSATRSTPKSKQSATRASFLLREGNKAQTRAGNHEVNSVATAARVVNRSAWQKVRALGAKRDTWT